MCTGELNPLTSGVRAKVGQASGSAVDVAVGVAVDIDVAVEVTLCVAVFVDDGVRVGVAVGVLVGVAVRPKTMDKYTRGDGEAVWAICSEPVTGSVPHAAQNVAISRSAPASIAIRCMVFSRQCFVQLYNS
jgi:hypothetical protein